jgi:hypothetical protein
VLPNPPTFHTHIPAWLTSALNIKAENFSITLVTTPKSKLCNYSFLPFNLEFL